MEFEEMNQRAYRREAPLDELTPAERMIYMALCLLYELHFAGRYTREEGVALKRLFLDGDHDRFILRTEQPAHPGVALLPQDCPGRILGRVSWVLQNV